jgi:hypothetical protein
MEATDVEGNLLLGPSMAEMLRGRYRLLALRQDGPLLNGLVPSTLSSSMLPGEGSEKWTVESRCHVAGKSVDMGQF